MDLLVLGGTGFVGRAIVDDALSRGWNVTTLNRGTRPAGPEVTALKGDRSTHGLAALGSQRWDVVADTWSFAPSVVRESASLLADRCDRYLYVSSRSVYGYPTAAGSDETAPVVESSSSDTGFDDYARAKAGAEAAVIEAFGDRALLARAGLILGPHEDIGRLPWWLNRIARGGDVIAPGEPGAGIQYIDARDLAAWSLSGAAAGLGGAVNVVSPVGFATMGSLLQVCIDATGSSTTLRWVDPSVLASAGAEPWTGLPAWLPPGEAHDTMHAADVSKAIASGLRCRPIAETVADTWSWLGSIGGTAPQRSDRQPPGLSPETEARVMALL